MKIARFSGELSKGLPKTAARSVQEMVYGIQASQSVVSTTIGRPLEEPISIKKVEEIATHSKNCGGHRRS
jgi:hypothetical protein